MKLLLKKIFYLVGQIFISFFNIFDLIEKPLDL